LEATLQDELRGLGFEGQVDKGALEGVVDAATLRRIHVESRIASRVTVKLATVEADSLDTLAERVRKLPWKTYIHPRQPVEVKATCTASRVKHHDWVEAKVAHAIADALRGPRLPGAKPPKDPLRIIVRLHQDKATLRVDASGELLHKRGWRLDVGGAPLRENLAAALLRAAGWHPGMPLVDPMCGSGTLVIEAALWAAGRAPGGHRNFAFEQWPGWPNSPSQRPPENAVETSLFGADRDEASIDRARQNAGRARVDRRIRWAISPFEDLELPPVPGLLIMNPPWGERLGRPEQVANLHSRWATRIRTTWTDWTAVVLVPDTLWAKKAWGGDFRPLLRFSSGGTRVVALRRSAGPSVRSSQT
jgi:putative N6-adenine-specific DNA methylase